MLEVVRLNLTWLYTLSIGNRYNIGILIVHKVQHAFADIALIDLACVTFAPANDSATFACRYAFFLSDQYTSHKYLASVTFNLSQRFQILGVWVFFNLSNFD